LKSEADQSFYIGQTQNIGKRLIKHNAGLNQSTSTKRPWKLIHEKVCETRSDAMKHERYLKSLKKRSAVLQWIEKDIRGVAQPGPDFTEISDFDVKSRVLEK
jgi:putative endonuclease